MMKFIRYRSEMLWKMLCAGIFMVAISSAQMAWANGGVFFDDMDQAFKEQKVSYFGTVRDKKGKGLADVKVLVTVAREKVETYTVQSDSRGKYRTPTYSGVDTRRVQLFAEKPGYKFSEVVQIRGPKKVGDATEADIIMAAVQ
jgi:hypothetical protein